MTLPWPEPRTPPAGDAQRFGVRWRLVGAGLSNVWRFGDLELPAVSGRLLLRGPNGTGKTTALEVLWPYLLDLNAARLAAGKARNTHLSSLMRESADGRRRVGYVWLSFAGPDEDGVVSYGARLNFSEGGTPPVKVTPFTTPGRPLHELALWGPGRAALSAEQFADTIRAVGGMTFDEPENYVRDLATRVFATDPSDLTMLAQRIREVRNPALLGELSPRDAADALRASLPGVADEVIEATGEALAESDTTRRAFEADRDAAHTLEAFARTWTGHVVEVTTTFHHRALEAAEGVRQAVRRHRRSVAEHAQATIEANTTREHQMNLADELETTRGRLAVIERSDEYLDAGRLAQLADSVSSHAATADAKWTTLAVAAAQAVQISAGDGANVINVADDIAALIDGIAALEPAVAGTRVVVWDTETRVPFNVGDRSVDAGPVLRVHADIPALDSTIALLAARSDVLSREADLARTFVTAHEAVARADKQAEHALGEAGRLGTTAEEKALLAKRADTVARREAISLGEHVAAWLIDLSNDPGFDDDDLDDVDWSDPPVALAAADQFVAATATWAHEAAAAARARADDADERAADLRRQASELRTEAERIRREDVLLPLPRPDWAGDGDDEVAFGSAIDWADGVAADTQDVVEATIAAAGLLGGTLTTEGVATEIWTVAARGPAVAPNLGALLRPDPGHPLAGVAAAVLDRITIATTAVDTSTGGLIVGVDGTFRVGVLTGAVPGAQDPALRRTARHIGARRRREAALAHADALDVDAAGLDEQATDLEVSAEAERVAATQALADLSTFPKREQLRDAEAARVAAARAQHEADKAAAEAEAAANELALVASRERRQWTDAVVGAGLIADVAQLEALIDTAKPSIDRLRETAGQLDRKFRRRLDELVAAVVDHDSSAVLESHHAAAEQAHRDAETARAGYEELAAQVGRSADEVVARHQRVKARLDELGPLLRSAEMRFREADNKAVQLKAQADAAKVRADEAAPVAARTLAELRTLLAVPGVVEAVLGAEPEADGAALLVQVGSALTGRPTSAKRTLRERADETRARLAGVWSVDPGVDHAELDTYLLTHGTTSLTPVPAADHARLLATRAEEALRAADEAALRDFVIGRLPAAIAQAWTRLFDWVTEVNAKMRSASASSGVGVAVRVSVRDELPPLVRSVYELACKTGDALRDPGAKAEAGRAIHQLINAADGEEMTSRVREAVDVRDWVDVVYQVTRPGEAPRNWGSRTGLSGGERRLVVLAPMLAAVAAAYDRFPAHAGRLAALDEIPSEVDEEGREGLARYIAELDVDLIATSHHWNGAPGAWDGIDAYDLEGAPDGTVVAFPMLIRGLDSLPGDHPNVHALPPV